MYVPQFEMQYHTIRPNMNLPLYWEIENWTTDRCLVRFYTDRNIAVFVTYSKWSKNDRLTEFWFSKTVDYFGSRRHSSRPQPFPAVKGYGKKMTINDSRREVPVQTQHKYE